MKRARARTWLLAFNAVLLVLPATALVALRYYDVYLLRQTERQLIAQSAVIAELYRDAWMHARQHVTDPDPRSPARKSEHYTPVEPQISWDTRVLPVSGSEHARDPVADTAAHQAGKRIEAGLRRAQVYNLSAVRVLDARGCVVATTRGDAGRCLNDAPEVARALAGSYAVTARQRVSDEAAPPVGDIRRRGKVRIFTAMPIWEDGRVIGVVAASRTGLDALSSLWRVRRGLVVTALTVGSLAVVLTLALSWLTITRPLTRLAHKAAEVARGHTPEDTGPSVWTPREMVELEASLDAMTRELSARATYIAEFAATASHELKTPITSVRGAAELMEDGWQDMSASQRARFMRNIIEDTGRMQDLVDRLLLLARLESPRAASEPVTDIDLLQALPELLVRHGERVALLVTGAPRVRMAEAHLRSVLGNLVDNALSAQARGDAPNAPIEVHVEVHQAEVVLEVRDTGPGVKPGNRERIFERFFTTCREIGGTGLGLPIVRAIAELYGGHVAWDAAEGTTVFRLSLPASRRDRPQARAKPTTR